MDITSIVGTIFSGGITGIIGSISSAIANYKLKKLEYKHQEEMADLEMKKLELQTKLRMQLSEQELRALQEKADIDIQKLSYEQDKATYSQHIDFSKYGKIGTILGGLFSLLLIFVDFLRGIIRPGTTIVFEIYMFLVWFTLYRMLHSTIIQQHDRLLDLFTHVTYLLLFVATTCITWWFGNRQIDKWFQQKLK